MQTFVGNGFYAASDGDVVCITTNGEIKKDGLAVMGAGIAKFARDTFKGVDKKLAELLSEHGNRAFRLGQVNYKNKKITLATYPTKHDWSQQSDLILIEKSAKQLVEMANKFGWKKVWVPAPGCSNGGLSWAEVEIIIKPILDERFIIFSREKDTFTF